MRLMTGSWVRNRILRGASGALTVALVLLGSCKEAATGPGKTSDQGLSSGLFGGGTSNPTLLACPTNDAQSTSSLIGALGGTVTLGGTIVTVPIGVLTDQTLEVSLPAGN